MSPNKTVMNENSRHSSDQLAVLTVGLGSVATTLIAGVAAIRRGWAQPIGSLTQMGILESGPEPKKRISEALSLPSLDQLVFGAWDIFPQNAYESALKARVLDPQLLEKLKPYLRKIHPMKGVFDPRYLKMLSGPHIKKKRNQSALISDVRKDIRGFLKKNHCQRAVMVVASSTEIHHNKKVSGASPTEIYMRAALLEGVPVANATPNRWRDEKALFSLARATNTPFAGSDLKTGQTLIKTVVASGLRRRHLGVKGWFSTNILGNQDGWVLSDRGAFETKRISKEEGLQRILSATEQPDLYRNLTHLIEINYYPPKGDNKEGWDNIDLFGWLGYPMQLKINFLCRDSILAAPLVLDLVLFLDWAKRQGMSGPQDWLGFYFKSPMALGMNPSHDLWVQYEALQKTIQQHKNSKGGD